jgi:hypothetical protein
MEDIIFQGKQEALSYEYPERYEKDKYHIDNIENFKA